MFYIYSNKHSIYSLYNSVYLIVAVVKQTCSMKHVSCISVSSVSQIRLDGLSVSSSGTVVITRDPILVGEEAGIRCPDGPVAADVHQCECRVCVR